MADNRVSEIMKDIVGEIRNIANSQTVVGQPIQAGDKTVIPVVKVTLGFGAGGGQGEDQSKSGFGGGGGGGVRVEPAAFIIIDKDQVSLLPARPGKLETLIEAIPALITKVIDAREGKKEKAAEGSNPEPPKPEDSGTEHRGW